MTATLPGELIRNLSHAEFRRLLERKLKAMERKTMKREEEIYRDITQILFLVGDWGVDQRVKSKRRKPE
jgi:hypothetical protein